MEVGRLLSKWWFVALVSLAIGAPATYLVHSLVWHSIIPSMLSESPSLIQFLFAISFFMIYGGYLVSFTCLFLTFGPRHVIDGERFLGPDDLVCAGYEVTTRKGSFDVRVAKYSVLRVYEGGRTFRCLPTSTALWTIVILFLSVQLVVLAFPIVMYVHKKCWKWFDTMIDEGGGPPAHLVREIDDMLEDSLMGAYRLAVEAVNVKRSAFHDHVIILVVLGLVSWMALLLLSSQDIVGSHSFLLGLGTLLIAVIILAGALILRKRIRENVEHDERWAERLLSAVRGGMGRAYPSNFCSVPAMRCPVG